MLDVLSALILLESDEYTRSRQTGFDQPLISDDRSERPWQIARSPQPSSEQIQAEVC